MGFLRILKFSRQHKHKYTLENIQSCSSGGFSSVLIFKLEIYLLVFLIWYYQLSFVAPHKFELSQAEAGYCRGKHPSHLTDVYSSKLNADCSPKDHTSPESVWIIHWGPLLANQCCDLQSVGQTDQHQAPLAADHKLNQSSPINKTHSHHVLISGIYLIFVFLGMSFNSMFKQLNSGEI